MFERVIKILDFRVLPVIVMGGFGKKKKNQREKRFRLKCNIHSI